MLIIGQLSALILLYIIFHWQKQDIQHIRYKEVNSSELLHLRVLGEREFQYECIVALQKKELNIIAII